MEIPETPAHQARARLRTRGRTYEVLEVRGEERLNLGYYFSLNCRGSPARSGP